MSKYIFLFFFCHNYWFFFLPCLSNYLSRFLATFQYFKFLLTDPILFYSLFCLFFVEKILLRFLFVLFQPVHLTLIWKFVSQNIVLLILKLSCMYLLTQKYHDFSQFFCHSFFILSCLAKSKIIGKPVFYIRKCNHILKVGEVLFTWLEYYDSWAMKRNIKFLLHETN